MNFYNEQLLQRVTTEILERTTPATSNQQILKQVRSDFTTSNKQQVNFNEWQATKEKLYFPRSSSSIKKFCDKCLSEILLSFPRFLKYSNLICTSQTKVNIGTRDLKLNAPLKYFITDGCWGMCWYFILSTWATVFFCRDQNPVKYSLVEEFSQKV